MLATAAFAQFDPENVQVISYFPQLAVGGSSDQQWTTSLTFTNPHSSLQAIGTVYLIADNGQPLALDFGSGAVSSFTFNIPPRGAGTYTTTGTSPNILTGWAIVISTLPIQGVVQYRFSVNGIPQQGVSAQSTSASQLFRSPATISTGVAIANIYQDTSVPISVSAINASGYTLASTSLTLDPMAHESFTVGQIFPTLAPTFRGTVLLSGSSPSFEFVAWTLSGDSVLSSYPPSALGWPVSQYQRIWKVWQKIMAAAVQMSAGSNGVIMLGTEPELVIDYSTSQINSFADLADTQVHISMSLAELISDSESELGFVVGHEVGHIIQNQNGHLIFGSGNSELDADTIGMFLSLMAGYDPYGAAGALAKLSMASGTADLVDQNFDNLLVSAGLDPHGSFNNRLASLFAEMQVVCSQASAQSFCSSYKSIVHPHLPGSAPLSTGHGLPGVRGFAMPPSGF